MVRKIQNLEIVIRKFFWDKPADSDLEEGTCFVLSLEQGNVDRGSIALCSGDREDVYKFAESVQSSLQVLGFKIARKEESL